MECVFRGWDVFFNQIISIYTPFSPQTYKGQGKEHICTPVFPQTYKERVHAPPWVSTYLLGTRRIYTPVYHKPIRDEEKSRSTMVTSRHGDS